MTRSQLALVPLLFFGLVTAACKDGSSSPPPGGDGSEGGGGNSGVIVLRGGERIAWDQAANSALAARSYVYRLFVDGTEATLANVQCGDPRSAAGYPCSGLLPSMRPGQHILELAAIADGRQSNSSVPLVVTVGMPSMTGNSVEPEAVATASITHRAMCLSVRSVECYDARVIAENLGHVTSLRSAPSGRVFLIEDGRRIRLIRGNALEFEPALEVWSPRVRLISMALPPDFEGTHFVFVAWAEEHGDTDERLHVTRYREVQGTLGEAATIVTDLTIPPGADVPIAIDDRGLLYMAHPGSSSSVQSVLGSSILRFDADGAVPPANAMFSTVIAEAYASPSSLVWDRSGRRMWLAGSGSPSQAPILELPISGDGRVGRPVVPILDFVGAVRAVEVTLPLITLTTGFSAKDASSLWLVPSPGIVLRGAVGESGASLVFSQVRLDALGSVTAVVGEPSGALFAVAESVPARVRASKIWLLVPAAVALPRP